MLAASFLAIFIIPVCYYLVEKIGGKKPAPAPAPPESEPPPAASPAH
jgi:hypothetical protein